jgi:hypothetical protein
MVTTDANKESEVVQCVWGGCTATMDVSNWNPILGPMTPGWQFACGIPPDDRDGPLCPLHGQAFEDWAQFELLDISPSSEGGQNPS